MISLWFISLFRYKDLKLMTSSFTCDERGPVRKREGCEFNNKSHLVRSLASYCLRGSVQMSPLGVSSVHDSSVTERTNGRSTQTVAVVVTECFCPSWRLLWNVKLFVDEFPSCMLLFTLTLIRIGWQEMKWMLVFMCSLMLYVFNVEMPFKTKAIYKLKYNCTKKRAKKGYLEKSFNHSRVKLYLYR